MLTAEDQILIEKKRLASMGEHASTLTLGEKAIAAILNRMQDDMRSLKEKVRAMEKKALSNEE